LQPELDNHIQFSYYFSTLEITLTQGPS